MGWVSDELSNFEDSVRDVGRKFEDEVVEDVFGGYEGVAAAIAAPFVAPMVAPTLGSIGSGLGSAVTGGISGLGSLGSSALSGLGALGSSALGGLQALGGAALGGLDALGGFGGLLGGPPGGAGGLGGGGGLLGLLTDYYAGESSKDAVRDASRIQAAMFERGITSAEDAQARLEAGLEPFAAMGRGNIPGLQQQIGQSSQLTPDILQSPLLKSLQDDVTRRVFANQAARGRAGGTETAIALQNALVPQAINFGLSQQDLRQRDIDNLFRSVGVGQSSAAQTGVSGLTTAANVGNLSGQMGSALAFDPLGRAQARNQQFGGLQSFLT
jgi:hypothetical protein